MKFKPLLVLILLISSPFQLLFGQFTAKQIAIDGLNRTYHIHVPANYSASSPASVVVWLHGMGTINISDVQRLYGANQFVPISDTANFILLVPVAENFALLNMRAWNSQAGVLGISPNADINDFGFIDAMLDEVIDEYAVNQNRMYVCGFSMGGFMTQRFALQHNQRFAAYASVSGTIGANVTSQEPNRPIRLAHFHGTNDATVDYTNNTFGMGAEAMLAFWLSNNQCDTTPIHTYTYETMDPQNNDTISVDYYVYGGGSGQIEFHKENGAPHVWLEDNAKRIWLFFNQFEGVLGIEETTDSEANQAILFPNPTSGKVTLQSKENIEGYLRITDITGRTLFTQRLKGQSFSIDLQTLGLSPGLYFINHTDAQRGSHTQKVILR